MPFDERISQPSLPSRASKAQKPHTKLSKSTRRSPIQVETSEDDAIQLLCDQAKGLDLNAPPTIQETEDNEDVESKQEGVSDKNAKKKAKAAEVGKKGQAVLESLNEAGRQILQELPDIKRPNQSWSGCAYCKVALCKRGVCWTKWHAQEGSN